jgi:hypothetical protein
MTVRETDCFAISQEQFDPSINPTEIEQAESELIQEPTRCGMCLIPAQKNLGSTNKSKTLYEDARANPIRQRYGLDIQITENDFISTNS